MEEVTLDPYGMRIWEMGFSTRTVRCLEKVGIHTLADLESWEWSAAALWNIRLFGRGRMAEVCRKLRELGRPLPFGYESYITEEDI